MECRVLLCGGAKSCHEKATIWCVFAWQPFAPPCKDTTHLLVACFCSPFVVSSPGSVKGRLAVWKVATQKHAMSFVSCFCLLFSHFLLNIIIRALDTKTWRVFAWRPFAPPGENTTNGTRNLAIYKCVISSPCGAKGRYAKTCQMVILAGFGMATFRPARQRYDKQEAIRWCMKSVVQVSCGRAKGRHAKTRKVTIWRVVTWRLSPFRPKSMIIRHGTNQPPYNYHGSNLMHFLAY